jgi:SAM-dependent methyltransferase
MINVWDLAYLTGLTPWESDTPPSELTELIEKNIIKPCRVIDIGCGTGTTVVYLAEKGFEAHGLDISSVAISKARKKASSRMVKCTFYNIDFRETSIVRRIGEFELAIDVGCFHSLHPGIDRIKYLNSLNTILKKDGKYLLWCFKKNSLGGFGPPGVEEDEVENLFKDNFKIIEKHVIDTPFRILFFYFMQKIK